MQVWGLCEGTWEVGKSGGEFREACKFSVCGTQTGCGRGCCVEGPGGREGKVWLRSWATDSLGASLCPTVMCHCSTIGEVDLHRPSAPVVPKASLIVLTVETRDQAVREGSSLFRTRPQPRWVCLQVLPPFCHSLPLETGRRT